MVWAVEVEGEEAIGAEEVEEKSFVGVDICGGLRVEWGKRVRERKRWGVRKMK